MTPDALMWLVSQINSWRKEAGIVRKINAMPLERILTRIQKVGVEEELAAYVVLGCEWLFRVKRISDRDIEEMLLEIEDALVKILEPNDHLAYWMTEAIAPNFRKVLQKEGRMLVSLGLYLPGESSIGRFLFREDEKGPKRTRPTKVVPERRGPIPWPAPWIASCLVERIFPENYRGKTSLAMDLASVLAGRSIEPADFRRMRKALAGEALDELLSAYRQWYKQLLRDAGSAEWWQALRSDLATRIPAVVFPGDLQLTQNLLASYRSSPRKGK